MKLAALLVALTVGCGVPPVEVEEIQQKLITRYPPFAPSHAAYIYVGGLAFSSQAGVLWMDVSGGFPGPCMWEELGDDNGQVDQDLAINGSLVADYMEMINAAGGATIQCSNGSYWLLPYSPTASSRRVSLFGGPGNDLLICAPSAISTWGFSNCLGGAGNDWIFLDDPNGTGRGGPDNDTIVKYFDGTLHQSAAFGDAGNDCITWSGGTNGGIADCGSGTDKVKGLLGSVNCEATNGCGF